VFTALEVASSEARASSCFAVVVLLGCLRALDVDLVAELSVD
jgi:hypothetical protein